VRRLGGYENGLCVRRCQWKTGLTQNEGRRALSAASVRQSLICLGLFSYRSL